MAASPKLERVETPRLVCERLRMEHLPDITRLLGDPRVSQWLWPHGGPTERDLIESTQQKEEHWERHGFGLWLLRDRQTYEAVGWGGLQWTYIADIDAVEAAWAVVPDRWGQGLATELAQALTEVAFGALGLREIVAFTLPDNLASRRVMEKAGFVYERDVVHALLPHVLYRRRAEESRAEARRAEESRAETRRAETRRAEASRAEASRAEAIRAEAILTEARRTGASLIKESQAPQ